MTRSDLMDALAVRLASLNLTPEDTEQAVRLLLDEHVTKFDRRPPHRNPGFWQLFHPPTTTAPRPKPTPGYPSDGTHQMVPHFKPGKILRAAVDVCATIRTTAQLPATMAAMIEATA